MKTAIILFALTFTPRLFACITLPITVQMTGTVFEEEKAFQIHGAKITFQPGTNDETHLTFDQTQQHWCYTGTKHPERKCLIGNEKVQLTDSEDNAYADVEIKQNMITLYPLTPDGKRTANEIYIYDKSNESADILAISSRLCNNDKFSGCAGGRLDYVSPKNVRSLNVKPHAAGVADVQSAYWEANACTGLKKVKNSLFSLEDETSR